jgi:hypothetical protein
MSIYFNKFTFVQILFKIFTCHAEISNTWIFLTRWTWLLVPYGFTIVNSMGITASSLSSLYIHLYIRYFYGGSLGVNYSKL